MKITIGPNTVMYQKAKVSAGLKLENPRRATKKQREQTNAEMLEFFAVAPDDPEPRLAAIEAAAQAALNGTADQAEDAKLALHLIRLVRGGIKEGHLDFSVALSLRLGAVAERMGIREFEPLVRRGRENKRATDSANASNAEAAEANRKLYQALADKIWASHPSRSVNDVAKQIAEQLKGEENPPSAETIRKRIKKPAP